MIDLASLSETDVLCVYGLGNGDIYKQLQPWLSENRERVLLFIEDEEEALKSISFLETPQTRILFITKDSQDEIFKKVCWEFVFLRFSYMADPSYLEKKKERCDEVFAKMSFFQSGVDLLASDYSDYGMRILKNLKSNSFHLPNARKGETLKNHFAGTPAIICGGGPSLAKNIHLLSQLSNHALIFAGGSALKVLAHHKIVPHFGASLDPDPPYQRFLEQSAFEVPFFYQDRVSKDLLFLTHSPLLWISDNGGYPLERWFLQQLQLSDQPFEGGWNVGNFCTALSECLGCDPIIFVGMDLCSSDDRLYAPGVEEKLQKDKLILVHDREGKPFYSRRDWVMAAQWIEAFALQHPDKLFINATEGGIGFKGMLHLTLAEVSEKYLKHSYDMKARVHTALEEVKKINLTKEQITNTWDIVDESVKRCEQNGSRLLSLVEETFPHFPPDKADFVLNQFELEQELFYLKLLDPLWNIWKHVLKRNMPEAFEQELGIFVNKILFFNQIITLWKDIK